MFSAGDLVIIRGPDSNDPPECVTITGCNHEKGRIVYDFDDRFGNPRWCYEEQVLIKLT